MVTGLSRRGTPVPRVSGDVARSQDGRGVDEMSPGTRAARGARRGVDLASAFEAYRAMARRDPGRHEAYFGMAWCLRRLGQPAGSILPVMTRAHELSPTSAVYRAVLASLLDRLGRREDAGALLRDLPPGASACRLLAIATAFWHGGGTPA